MSVRKIDGNGFITRVAGNGTIGNTGDGGQATAANLNVTSGGGLCVDGSGNIYIACTGSSTIRKVNGSTGIITTIAGSGVAGYSGDGGQATAAKLYNPLGICMDTANNLYITDNSNYRIRKH
jgi:sugar lactone lactonase YvrE